MKGLAAVSYTHLGEFSQDQAFLFDEAIHKLHPANRGLDTGFYDYEPDRVK